ncbi:phosphocarrier protein HPr [Aequitasia blattaphilus]|uniref:HPr family phosphocarrier protein n=1 Tax=Aequitasia blattaphilus TaxID=2949332 RepID=A0ABT1EDV8_9FIRM|nr:HPr family phosphocarrier protein [Aequitasia blattaphilus]MCP1103127.1 HPr family phosphocarrier protein [Aequitasia blattaphilus]MCR8615767.1 HPr family phosphocarrier protein [Aequitasia blattaphilus]
MKNFNYVVKDTLGLHARPAGLLVKEAGKFESTIMVHTKGKQANAKKLLALMSLAVKQEDEVAVTIEGADEDVAAQAMEVFFQTNL